jgi:hypothetical protein
MTSLPHLSVLLAIVAHLSGVAAEPILGDVYASPPGLWVRPLEEATTTPFHVHESRLSPEDKVHDLAFCTLDRPGTLTVLARAERTVVMRYDADGPLSARGCASGTVFQLAPAELAQLSPRVDAAPEAPAWASGLIVLALGLWALLLVGRACWTILASPRMDTPEPASEPPAEEPSADPPPPSGTRAKNIRL